MDLEYEGMYVTLQEGTHAGSPVIKARVRKALTMEHAMSILAQALTARGMGDAEVYAAEYRNGAYEVWYKRPPGWQEMPDHEALPDPGPLLPW